MPINIPPGHIQLALQFDCPSPGGTRRSVCTLGLEVEISAPKLNQIADSFVDEVWSEMGSSQYRYRGCTAITDEIGYAADRDVPGTLSAAPCTPNTALLVRKNTDFRGRANRGRFYFPGMCYESDIDGAGVINPAQLVGFQGFFQGWYDDLISITAQPKLLHQEPRLPTPIVGFGVEGTVATQRRRLRS